MTSTSPLRASDFTAFFQALHPAHGKDGGDGDGGTQPFPWQRRLVERVAETGRWPALLDLPTGSGKTAALDAAVFLLALRADQPRRVVFVVDRRIVVHQAAERAKHIAQRLQQAREGVLLEVAQRLRDRPGLLDTDVDQPPLEYAELRGGIVRDDDWIRRPDVPTLIVSTVDQVGSRLLFRGYGVSSGMRPVHAGLLGNDVLYLLDEVHLAEAFAQTLTAIGSHYRPPREAQLPERFQVVELSATPTGERCGGSEEQVLRLADEDRDPRVTPVLARRLAASKPARLRLVTVTGTDRTQHREKLAAVAAAEARTLLDDAGVRTVGVVVNRVDTAVRVHRLLAGQPDGHNEVGVLLLTGRMRPLDRDRLLAQYQDRLRTGRVRDDHAAPLILVATQAVEAGADIDLDALITECAALDALIQRFGRVDRAGDFTVRRRAAGPTTSVILASSADLSPTADDPVYGNRLRLTWEWLTAQDGLDFGIDVFAIDTATRTALSSPPSEAPFLLPSHLDRWIQTSAKPDADPDPTHWLHGKQPASADVSVVWRADVLPEAFAELEQAAAWEARERIAAVVSVCPPGSGEAVPVPVWAVQAWLAGLATSAASPAPLSFSDTVVGGQAGEGAGEVGGEGDDADTPGGRRAAIAPALSWAGDDSRVVHTVGDIQPGMTLVVPAGYGGLRVDCSNWDPTARGAVSDLGSAMHLSQRGRAVLRLHATLPGQEPGQEQVAIPQPTPASATMDEDRDVVLRWFDEWAERYSEAGEAGSAGLDAVVTALRSTPTRDLEVLRVAVAPGAGDGQAPREIFVLRSRRSVRKQKRDRRGVLALPRKASVADSEPSTSSFLGTEVPLEQHLLDVERWARHLGHALDLPDHLVADLALAGRLHDLGKVDPRFQLMLRGGEVSANAEPLAKSVLSAADYQKRQRALRASKYPPGTRHELASVALVAQDSMLREQANDWDLVLHLIASHHGYARSFVPVSFDDDPQRLRAELPGQLRVLEASSDHGLLRLDSGVPQRFWRCVRRYGWYGLAWLEAVLRLADHRASEERAG